MRMQIYMVDTVFSSTFLESNWSSTPRHGFLSGSKRQTIPFASVISDSADPSLLTSLLTYVFLLAFMFESSMMLTITDYAMKRSGKLHSQFCSNHDGLHMTPFTVHEPKMWDNLKAQFMNHLDTINGELKASNLPPLKSKN